MEGSQQKPGPLERKAVGSSQEQQVSQALWDRAEWKGPRCLLSSLRTVSASSQARSCPKGPRVPREGTPRGLGFPLVDPGAESGGLYCRAVRRMNNEHGGSEGQPLPSPSLEAMRKPSLCPQQLPTDGHSPLAVLSLYAQVNWSHPLVNSQPLCTPPPTRQPAPGSQDPGPAWEPLESSSTPSTHPPSTSSLGRQNKTSSAGFLLGYLSRGRGLRGLGWGWGRGKAPLPPGWGCVSGQQHTISFPPPVEINS